MISQRLVRESDIGDGIVARSALFVLLDVDDNWSAVIKKVDFSEVVANHEPLHQYDQEVGEC